MFHRKTAIIMALARKVGALKAALRSRDRRIQALAEQVAALEAIRDKLRAERAAAPADVSGGQRIHDPLAGAGGQRPRLPHGEFEPIGDACFTSFFHDEEVV